MGWVPECLRCGACCFGGGERYVPVSGDDHAQLGDAAEALTVFIGNRCYMRMHEGHCAALTVRKDGQFWCSVYERRPSVCRELARGSSACEAELLQKRTLSQRALLPLRKQPDARSPAPRSPMRSRRIPRCPTCGLSPGLCICAELPRIVTRTHVRVIAHRKEQFKSTNTGKLSARMLEGAAFECRTDPPRVAEAMAPYTWVLFPSEDALSLREAAALGVHTLLVPDGTWNQAKRIARRDPVCAGARHVRLDAPRESAYQLRRGGRPFGLCTLEAIAEALRGLEGDAPADAMLAAFERWVARARQVRAGAHEARS